MTTTKLLAALIAAAPLVAFAQTPPQAPGNDQVIVPQVDRRDVKLPRFPSKDFEVGAFIGTYSTQNFGSSAVYGLRLGYHITEDFFVQANFAQTKVSDEAFRNILPVGFFPTPTQTLKYYNLSAGYNLLPGEIFLGRNRAKASAVYLVAGVGNTSFAGRDRQTVNFGLGMRVLLSDRFSIQVDLRDHVYSHDLLGTNESTQNIELTTGLSFYF